MRIILVDISAFLPAFPAASILWNTPDSCGISQSLLDVFPLLLLVVFENKTSTPCICIYLASNLFPFPLLFWITSCFRTSGLEHSSADQSPSCDLALRPATSLWGPSLVAWSKCVAVGRGHPLLPMTVSGSRRAAGPGRETREEASGWRAAAAIPSRCAGHEEPAFTPTLPLCQVCHPHTALQSASTILFHARSVLQDVEYWFKGGWGERCRRSDMTSQWFSSLGFCYCPLLWYLLSTEVLLNWV